MNGDASSIGIAIAAFVSTNIDDFVLIGLGIYILAGALVLFR